MSAMLSPLKSPAPFTCHNVPGLPPTAVPASCVSPFMVKIAAWPSGDGGSQVLYGDDGNDTLWGGRRTDTLHGGAGDDKLYAGYDTFPKALYGDDGNDTLYGGYGSDTLNGG